MSNRITRSLIAASFVLGLSAVAVAPAQAQGSSTTRAQAKMDRDTFLSMARWDEMTGQWVLKSDVALPDGLVSRAEVVAMRDRFLSMNTWDEINGWMPVKGTPRDMSKLTRDQVHMETVRFLMMHRFDEGKREWVSKAR